MRREPTTRPWPGAVLPVAAAVALVLVLGTLGTLSIAFTDYEVEAEPAATALAGGHLGRFAELAPAYGGSLVLRAPLAWAAALAGQGSGLGLYRALALPALAALVLLAVGSWRVLAPVTPRGAWLALLLVAGNPFALRALEVGHPEEVVGAVLCVGAVLAAREDRWLAAGLLLGCAGANKPWAVLAALPVLLTLEHHRGRCALVTGAVCAGVMAPLLLAGSATRTIGEAATAQTVIFQPWQLFWFSGEHAGAVVGLMGEKVGFRTASGWAQVVSHPLVVLAGFAIALAWWRRRSADTALALLALVLLTRCVLDTWNTDYYALPLLFALLAHEAVARRRAPVATLVLVLALWVCFALVRTPDAQAAAYLLVAGAAWAGLALAAFAPARAAALTAQARARAARALPTLLPQPTS